MTIVYGENFPLYFQIKFKSSSNEAENTFDTISKVDDVRK